MKGFIIWLLLSLLWLTTAQAEVSFKEIDFSMINIRNSEESLLLPMTLVGETGFPNATLAFLVPVVVPECSTMLLLGSGLFGLAAFIRRTKTQNRLSKLKDSSSSLNVRREPEAMDRRANSPW